MQSIPQEHAGDLDLYQLRVLDVLLRERSLTRGALVLNTTQSGLSKALAKLRKYFNDPLFVRVSLKMEPTPKTLGMADAVRAILENVQTLHLDQLPFDPQHSARTFSLFAADAAVVLMLPPIVKLLQEVAPNIHIDVVQVEAEHLTGWLQSGKVDLAVGAYPMLTQGIRKQRLFTAGYTSLMRRGHPRLTIDPSLEAFTAEKHVLVSASGTIHAITDAEEALKAAIPPCNVTLRVRGSITAAVLAAKQTDALVTLPAPLAAVLAREFDLERVRTPVKLPKFEVAQYWHERFHKDPGSQWMRSIIHAQFGSSARAELEKPF